MMDDDGPTAHELLTVTTVDLAFLLGACGQAEVVVDPDLVARHRQAVAWLAENAPRPTPPTPAEPEPTEPEEGTDDREDQGSTPEG